MTNDQNPKNSEDLEFEQAMSAAEAEFEASVNQYLPGGSDNRGEIVEMTVVEVRDGRVLIDAGGKEEASISIEEFPLIGTERAVKVGDRIQVVQYGRGEGGSRYSHREARRRAAQRVIREAKEGRSPVKGTITQVVKGGVMVDVGLEAFMPASQMNLFKVPDLKDLVGTEIEAYVIDFDPRRNRAVLSRRQLLFERRESDRKNFLEGIVVGSVVTGKVKNATDFGVFVELGIVDGFIPREQVSHDRGRAPKEVVTPGESIEVKVTKIDPETGKITLSRVALLHNPWEEIEAKYPKDSIVRGKVIAIQQYGAFVQVEEGITGMVHAGDMSWTPGNKKPEDYVQLNQEITCIVLEVNREKRRLSLGLKQLLPDPWAEVSAKFTEGTKLDVTISAVTNFGAFAKLTDQVEGMIHVKDLSWERHVSSPKDCVKVGDKVSVVVLGMDEERRRVKLGMKQGADSPYDAFLKANPIGSIVKGKVTRLTDYGAFVELAPALEGLIHISQIAEKRVELPDKELTIGQEVTVKIKEADRKKQRIALSRKEALRDAEREETRQYMGKNKGNSPSGMNFGEALRAAQEGRSGN
jgi:small subunit ribosomal protein S1